jgi:chemotaxis protein MotB
LTLEGHTDAQPFPGGERGYSNWELSADRANASRRELISGGLPEARTLRVQGLASSKLLEVKQPESPINRRISIIVMNRDAEDAVLKNTPDEDPPANAPAPGGETNPSSSIPKPR